MILVVEDREDDVILLRRAFRVAGILNPVMVVRTGEEAASYLAGEGNYRRRSEFPLPQLILLDLKLPEMDGFEVLEWVRSQKEFSGIVVIVLTSSDSMKDIKQAYDLGANSFIVKDTEFENTVMLARLLKDYWLQMNRAIEAQRRPKRDRQDGPTRSA